MVLSNMHEIYFVYNHYDDDDDFLSAILEGVIHSTFRFHEMNSQIFFPFEINETIICGYYLEEMFNDNLKKKIFRK